MNTDPDRDALLDAVLGDEDWQALRASTRAAALAAFRARHRRQRLGQWGALAAGVALALGATWAWMQPALAPLRPEPPAQLARVTPAPAPAIPAAPLPAPESTPSTANSSVRYISEEQLLAMFPPGSCVIAEINGQKQFVILDPKIAAEGLALKQNS
jgi:hypothetical protein